MQKTIFDRPIFYIIFFVVALVCFHGFEQYLFNTPSERGFTVGVTLKNTYGADGVNLVVYRYQVEDRIYEADQRGHVDLSRSVKYLVVFSRRFPSRSILLSRVDLYEKNIDMGIRLDTLYQKQIKQPSIWLHPNPKWLKESDEPD